MLRKPGSYGLVVLRPHNARDAAGETGNFQLSGLHAHQFTKPERKLPVNSAHHEQKASRQTQRGQSGTTTPPRPAVKSARRMAAFRATRILSSLRSANQHPRDGSIPHRIGTRLVSFAPATKPEMESELGADGQTRYPMAAVGPNLSSLALGSFRRQNSR
jgi:hypothetical protein